MRVVCNTIPCVRKVCSSKNANHYGAESNFSCKAGQFFFSITQFIRFYWERFKDFLVECLKFTHLKAKVIQVMFLPFVSPYKLFIISQRDTLNNYIYIYNI